MKQGDKLVCKNNIIYDKEYPLILEQEYLLQLFISTKTFDQYNMTTYSVYDPLTNNVCYITITGDQDIIWDIFYSPADYRDIKLNELGIN